MQGFLSAGGVNKMTNDDNSQFIQNQSFLPT